MGAARMTLAVVGALVAGYGVWLMLRWQTVSQLVAVGEWAVAAVAIHDGVLAPLAVAVGWVVRRRLPDALAGPTAVALLLVGTTAVAGFAVLTRSHGGGENRTLLDRDYPAGMLVAAAVIVVGVGAGSLVASGVRRRRDVDGTGHGRR